MNAVNILVVDDHVLFREGVVGLLATTDKFKVCMEVENGQKCLDYLNSTIGTSRFPDICLLDISMPVLNGYDTMRLIGDQYPNLAVLVLTMYDADYSVLSMLKSGARGFLPKNCGKQTLLHALDIISAGEFYIPQQLSKKLVASSKNQIPGLTDREVEFLSYCHQDMSYKEISAVMHVSERTVHGYRNNLFFKLDRKSRSGLVDYAFKTGIVGITE